MMLGYWEILKSVFDNSNLPCFVNDMFVGACMLHCCFFIFCTCFVRARGVVNKVRKNRLFFAEYIRTNFFENVEGSNMGSNRGVRG